MHLYSWRESIGASCLSRRKERRWRQHQNMKYLGFFHISRLKPVCGAEERYSKGIQALWKIISASGCACRQEFATLLQSRKYEWLLDAVWLRDPEWNEAEQPVRRSELDAPAYEFVQLACFCLLSKLPCPILSCTVGWLPWLLRFNQCGASSR